MNMKRFLISNFVVILSLFIILYIFNQHTLANGLLIGSALTSFVIWFRDKSEGIRIYRKMIKQSQ